MTFGGQAKNKKMVRLSGELDHHSAAEIRDKLDQIIAKTAPGVLVLDFSEVTLMDSSGIGLVIGRYKRLKAQGAQLKVCNLSRQIDQVFQLSGLYTIIEKL